MVQVPNSYPDIEKDDALKLCEELCTILFDSDVENDVVTLHKAGKQLTSLYFDCRSHRLIISDHLIKLDFLEYAVKTMKRLNNMGVFKSDDVWFASFYLYNICWNYSTINSEFGAGLMLCGIEHLLISNVSHDPYIDNLSKRNVNYLMSATLSIMNNILRTPGNRTSFSLDTVIKGLLKISNQDEKLSVLCTMCLSYIATNENIVSTQEFDIFYNVKVLFYCISKAFESEGKYKNYNIHEFFEVLKFASLSKLQNEAIIKLDGFNVMIEQLKSSKDERVKREILLTMINIIDNKNESKIKEFAKFYRTNKSPLVSSAANMLQWSIDIHEQKAQHNNNSLTSVPGKKKIFINFAKPDEKFAMKIFDCLGNLPKLELLNHDDNIEKLCQSYDEAGIIVVCVSEAFKNTISLKVGAEYITHKNKVIFPVLVQNNYKPEGWIKDFIYQVSDVCYNFTSDIEGNSEKFLTCLQSQLDGLFLCEVSKDLKMSNRSGVDQWLSDHNLLEISSKLIDIDMNLLHYMKRIRAEAPDFYFRALQSNMNLSFVEILKLSEALDKLK